MLVLIVEDHPVVVAACRALAAPERDISILDAPDGESGYLRWLATRPAVTVIDVNLPGLSGLALMERLLRHDPSAKIILFSMNDQAAFAPRALAAGARGYLSKSDDPALFVEALRTVAAGGVFTPARTAPSGRRAALEGLSVREIEILRLLGEGRSVAEIAALVDTSAKTVSNACSILKRKLGARTSVDLARIAIENGLA